jgi:hypothetical protein
MTSEKQMRYVTIIGDGYTDYVVLKKFVSVIFERLCIEKSGLTFLGDYESDKSLDKKISEINIGDAVAQFLGKANKNNGYGLFSKQAIALKKDIVEVLTKVLIIIQKKDIALSERDLLIISSDSERPLGNKHNYFQKWAYSLEAICWLAIEEFYSQMIEQGYEYQYLPLVLPLIFFPSIEILVAACTESAPDFDHQCRSLVAKPDLKQKVWATDSIDEARRNGMLKGVLEAYMTPEALDKVYQNIPEARKMIQILSFYRSQTIFEP